MKYISLGGWCGTTIALTGNNLRNEALPFDNIRSTFEGIIDCISNNFSNYFPKKIENEKGYKRLVFRSRYFGFLIHYDLTKNHVIESLKKRILRFQEIIRESEEKIVFVRTIITKDFEDETKLVDSFLEAVYRENLNLDFILIFIIPEQDNTEYFAKLKKNVFIFTLNDKSHNNCSLKDEYKPIFDLLENNNFDLLVSKPENKQIIKRSRLMYWNNLSITREDN